MSSIPSPSGQVLLWILKIGRENVVEILSILLLKFVVILSESYRTFKLVFRKMNGKIFLEAHDFKDKKRSVKSTK